MALMGWTKELQEEDCLPQHSMKSDSESPVSKIDQKKVQESSSTLAETVLLSEMPALADFDNIEHHFSTDMSRKPLKL